MKQFFATLVMAIAGLFCIQTMYADSDIIEKGKWGPEDIRSIVPPPPTASIGGKTLSVHFTAPLSNLTVLVKNSAGTVVYEKVITVSTPQSYQIELTGLASGEYTLSFVHRYGYLSGSFILE